MPEMIMRTALPETNSGRAAGCILTVMGFKLNLEQFAVNSWSEGQNQTGTTCLH
jgi:hypothetical protein